MSRKLQVGSVLPDSSMAELHGDLRAVARQTYRNWDLSDPALRRKWDEGDTSDFYPYGDTDMSMKRLMLQMAGAVDQFAGPADKG